MHGATGGADPMLASFPELGLGLAASGAKRVAGEGPRGKGSGGFGEWLGAVQAWESAALGVEHAASEAAGAQLLGKEGKRLRGEARALREQQALRADLDRARLGKLEKDLAKWKALKSELGQAAEPGLKALVEKYKNLAKASQVRGNVDARIDEIIKAEIVKLKESDKNNARELEDAADQFEGYATRAQERLDYRQWIAEQAAEKLARTEKELKKKGQFDPQRFEKMRKDAVDRFIKQVQRETEREENRWRRPGYAARERVEGAKAAQSGMAAEKNARASFARANDRSLPPVVRQKARAEANRQLAAASAAASRAVRAAAAVFESTRGARKAAGHRTKMNAVMREQSALEAQGNKALAAQNEALAKGDMETYAKLDAEVGRITDAIEALKSQVKQIERDIRNAEKEGASDPRYKTLAEKAKALDRSVRAILASEKAQGALDAVYRAGARLRDSGQTDSARLRNDYRMTVQQLRDAINELREVSNEGVSEGDSRTDAQRAAQALADEFEELLEKIESCGFCPRPPECKPPSVWHCEPYPPEPVRPPTEDEEKAAEDEKKKREEEAGRGNLGKEGGAKGKQAAQAPEGSPQDPGALHPPAGPGDGPGKQEPPQAEGPVRSAGPETTAPPPPKPAAPPVVPPRSSAGTHGVGPFGALPVGGLVPLPAEPVAPDSRTKATPKATQAPVDSTAPGEPTAAGPEGTAPPPPARTVPTDGASRKASACGS
ncbi:MAG: hypothetical protein ACT4PV_03850, partial [Planctomycetaceae bacterium]